MFFCRQGCKSLRKLSNDITTQILLKSFFLSFLSFPILKEKSQGNLVYYYDIDTV